MSRFGVMNTRIDPALIPKSFENLCLYVVMILCDLYIQSKKNHNKLIISVTLNLNILRLISFFIPSEYQIERM